MCFGVCGIVPASLVSSTCDRVADEGWASILSLAFASNNASELCATCGALVDGLVSGTDFDSDNPKVEGP